MIGVVQGLSIGDITQSPGGRLTTFQATLPFTDRQLGRAILIICRRGVTLSYLIFSGGIIFVLAVIFVLATATADSRLFGFLSSVYDTFLGHPTLAMLVLAGGFLATWTTRRLMTAMLTCGR